MFKWIIILTLFLSFVVQAKNIIKDEQIFLSPLTLQQKTTPSNPGSGYNKVYTKSDNLLYSLTQGGIESLLGPIPLSDVSTDGKQSSTNYIRTNRYATASQDGMESSTQAAKLANAVTFSDTASSSTAGIVKISDSYTATTSDTAASQKALTDGLNTAGGDSNNLITNYNAEKGITNPWTCTNATAALSTDYARTPTHSWKITATAGGGYCTASFTTLPGSLNYDSYFYYVTAATDITASPYLGANQKNTQTLSASTTMMPSFKNSLGTFVSDGTATAGTIKILMPTGGSIVYIDDIYVGINQNIGTVSQAFSFASKTWTTAASCIPSNSAQGEPLDFNSDSDCDASTKTIVGNAIPDASNDGRLPQIRLVNGGKGHYTIRAEGQFYAQASNISFYPKSRFRFNDGTYGSQKNGTLTGPLGANGYASQGVIIGSFDWDAFTEKTVKIQGSVDGGNGALIGIDEVGLTITVDYSPSASSQVGRFDEVGHGNGYVEWIGVGCSLNHTGTNYDDFTLLGCTSTLTRGDITTGTTVASITVPVLDANTEYEISTYFNVIANDGSNDTSHHYGIYDGTNMVSEYFLYTDISTSYNSGTAPMARVKYDSIQLNKTFSIRGEANKSNGGFYIPCRSGNHEKCGMSIKPVAPKVNQPQMIQATTTPYNGIFNGVIGSIAGNGSIVSAGTTGWASTKDTTGKYHATFPAGTFSSTPDCSCTDGTGWFICSYVQSTSSSTQANFQMYNTGTAAYADGPFSFRCDKGK